MLKPTYIWVVTFITPAPVWLVFKTSTGLETHQKTGSCIDTAVEGEKHFFLKGFHATSELIFTTRLSQAGNLNDLNAIVVLSCERQSRVGLNYSMSK